MSATAQLLYFHLAMRANDDGFIWYEQTKKRDKDNVAFAKKFILDGLVQAKKLINDNNQWVMGFSDGFVYGKGQKVVVEIYDCDEMEEMYNDGKGICGENG